MTTRKDFLIAGTAAAAIAPAAAGAATAPASGAGGEIPAFRFDADAWNGLLARRVQHRHCFASTALDGGDVCFAMTNTLDAYERNLGEDPVSATCAAVLYHGSAIALGFNDVVWDELLYPALPELPATFRDDLGKLVKGGGNPYLHKPASAGYDGSIERLVERGSAFLVCNNALSGVARQLADALGIAPATAYAKLANNLVPSGLIVPAGVWAVHALQEQGRFSYLQATL